MMSLSIIKRAKDTIETIGDTLNSEVVSRFRKQIVIAKEKALIESPEYEAFASFLQQSYPTIDTLDIRIAFEIAYIGITHKET